MVNYVKTKRMDIFIKYVKVVKKEYQKMNIINKKN